MGTWCRAAVVLLMLTGAACQRTTTVVHKPEVYNPKTWIGATVPAVEAVWGPAKLEESDASGGRIITYKGLARAVPLSNVATQGAPTGADAVDTPGLPNRDLLSDAMGPAPVSEPDVDARFWVNASGKVYRYWFSETIWRKEPGKTTRPSE